MKVKKPGCFMFMQDAKGLVTNNLSPGVRIVVASTER